MAKIRICKYDDCKDAATTGGFCRLHFLKNWKHLKSEEQKKAAKRLNKYVENMMQRHPGRYVDAIKKDIRAPGFERSIGEHFGADDEADSIFNEATYDEDVRELIEKLKSKDD